MSLLEQYKQAGQEQVLDYYQELDSNQQKKLEEQLSQFDPFEVNRIFRQSTKSQDDTGLVEALPSSCTASLLERNEVDHEGWRKLGLDAVENGTVAVILLAGGQGTRLGSSSPKGCYDIGLPSGRSLFEIQAERIKKVQQLAGRSGQTATIPWYIMTSGPTRAPTEAFFAKHKYFGLKENNVVFFEQGILPCLTKDGKIILESKDKVSEAPDGNGGAYKALHKSGIIQDLQKRGIKHIHMYCVDNSLVKVADPVFIGFAASHNADIATKVTRKRSPEEPVGLIVSRNGSPAVIEYSEIPKELSEARDEEDPSLLKLRAANIVNHYYSISCLEKTLELAKNQPFHVATKKIPYLDRTTGSTVKPDTANGIKLEQFVFDIFQEISFEKFACLEVRRDGEFSPVKNGPGSKEDCPETAREDVMKEGQRWLKNVGAKSGLVEVSPSLSFDGEGLGYLKGENISKNYLE